MELFCRRKNIIQYLQNQIKIIDCLLWPYSSQVSTSTLRPKLVCIRCFFLTEPLKNKTSFLKNLNGMFTQVILINVSWGVCVCVKEGCLALNYDINKRNKIVNGALHTEREPPFIWYRLRYEWFTRLELSPEQRRMKAIVSFKLRRHATVKRCSCCRWCLDTLLLGIKWKHLKNEGISQWTYNMHIIKQCFLYVR